MPSLFAPKGRAGGAGGVGSAPSEEDGGLTQQRLLILGSHLFLSLAHVFAVHQSAMESAGAEGRDENATRTYAYNPAMVVFLALHALGEEVDLRSDGGGRSLSEKRM